MDNPSDQKRVDGPGAQPAHDLPEVQRRDRRAARILAALQRVAELERDDRPQPAQVEPRAAALAPHLQMLEVLIEIDPGAMPGQPAKALVVRVAELLAADRRERAARDAAAGDAGSRRRRIADEQLQRRSSRAPPVTVVRLAEALGVRRAPAADRQAG